MEAKGKHGRYRKMRARGMRWVLWPRGNLREGDCRGIVGSGAMANAHAALSLESLEKTPGQDAPVHEALKLRRGTRSCKHCIQPGQRRAVVSIDTISTIKPGRNTLHRARLPPSLNRMGKAHCDQHADCNWKQSSTRLCRCDRRTGGSSGWPSSCKRQKGMGSGPEDFRGPGSADTRKKHAPDRSSKSQLAAVRTDEV